MKIPLSEAFRRTAGHEITLIMPLPCCSLRCLLSCSHRAIQRLPLELHMASLANSAGQHVGAGAA